MKVLCACSPATVHRRHMRSLGSLARRVLASPPTRPKMHSEVQQCSVAGPVPLRARALSLLLMLSLLLLLLLLLLVCRSFRINR